MQGWAELHLLQLSADFLLEGGATEESCSRIRDEGQELLRLTQVGRNHMVMCDVSVSDVSLLTCPQVNRSLYRADVSSETWGSYVDYIDGEVQDGLHQLLLRELHFLSDHMNPQVHTPVETQPCAHTCVLPVCLCVSL